MAQRERRADLTDEQRQLEQEAQEAAQRVRRDAMPEEPRWQELQAQQQAPLSVVLAFGFTIQRGSSDSVALGFGRARVRSCSRPHVAVAYWTPSITYKPHANRHRVLFLSG